MHTPTRATARKVNTYKDGLLITGQNPASSAPAAKELLEQLSLLATTSANWISTAHASKIYQQSQQITWQPQIGQFS